MFDVSTLENVHIYLSNVSTYYILSIVISFISIFITVYFRATAFPPPEERLIDKSENSQTGDTSLEETDDNLYYAETSEDLDEKLELSNMSPVLIKQFLKAQVPQKLLTEDQLSEEKRVEKKQLEAIFELMQKQQNKFEINSMDELQEQMELYGV